MLITSYNRRAFGDTLIAILGPDQQPQTVSQQGDVVGIFAGDTAIGFNFHHVAQWGVTGLTDGQVFLSESQIASLNAALARPVLPPSWRLTPRRSWSLVRCSS